MLSTRNIESIVSGSGEHPLTIIANASPAAAVMLSLPWQFCGPLTLEFPLGTVAYHVAVTVSELSGTDVVTPTSMPNVPPGPGTEPGIMFMSVNISPSWCVFVNARSCTAPMISVGNIPLSL